jgi:enoyl-CoA hydratase/3-hydroxyacyl-CoA dehydrogenase
MKKIKTVGVAGAGTMGSALAQKFAQEGFSVVLVDKEMRFVDNGIKRIKETLNEGIERKIFTPEQVNTIISRIYGGDNLNEFKKCGLVVEAIFENLDAKNELFQNLDKVVSSDIILATNTSSFSVTELSNSISNPERFLGMHYFYHAAKNRLVEIIPGEKTSQDTIKAMKNFAVLSGKDAIECKDSYGFVVNRFFVPWLNEAARLLEEGAASTEQIDNICMKVFSIGMGPFALMNATGVPIAYHSQKTLEKFGGFYKVSDALKKQTELNKPWDISETNETANDKTLKLVKDRMLGVVFLVCSQLLDEKVCNAVEINRGARIGLRWRRGPIDLMKKLGLDEASRLIKLICDKYNVEFPKSVNEKSWEMGYVKLDKVKDRAVITISRPEDMNALNEDIMCQLYEIFDKAEKDNEIKTIFITGEGKAFVAGADIKFFIDNIKANTLNKIVSFTTFGQQVYDKIDKSKKNVIGIINGLTLGGGLELALCCDLILAVPKAVFAFPETGIGIYPGLGGTQRTSKRIGTGLAKYMIYTGDFLSAKKAEKIGLADLVINYEDFSDIIEGTKSLPKSSEKKITDEMYGAYSDAFEKYSLKEILEDGDFARELPPDVSEKLVKKIKKKAPLALKTAEKLIDDAKGCESELEKLTYIFSTSDALLGLSSIGKSVEFQGK